MWEKCTNMWQFVSNYLASNSVCISRVGLLLTLQLWRSTQERREPGHKMEKKETQNCIQEALYNLRNNSTSPLIFEPFFFKSKVIESPSQTFRLSGI